jgi:hypothetical protein
LEPFVIAHRDVRFVGIEAVNGDGAHHDDSLDYCSTGTDGRAMGFIKRDELWAWALPTVVEYGVRPIAAEAPPLVPRLLRVNPKFPWRHSQAVNLDSDRHRRQLQLLVSNSLKEHIRPAKRPCCCS